MDPVEAAAGIKELDLPEGVLHQVRPLLPISCSYLHEMGNNATGHTQHRNHLPPLPLILYMLQVLALPRFMLSKP